MRVIAELASASLDDLKAALAGGTLTVYSVARPPSPDLPVDRSGVLASFTFATPAFGPSENGLETPAFVQAAVPAASVGTPGFARARRADGTTIADFSAGAGDREIKFAEVSCSPGAPVRVTRFSFQAEEKWPERPDYYNTRPRTGFPIHQAG